MNDDNDHIKILLEELNSQLTDIRGKFLKIQNELLTKINQAKDKKLPKNTEKL